MTEADCESLCAAELKCRHAEVALSAAKNAAKDAKAHLDACISDLRQLVAGMANDEYRPLFADAAVDDDGDDDE